MCHLSDGPPFDSGWGGEVPGISGLLTRVMIGNLTIPGRRLDMFAGFSDGIVG
jgi:hypothetical protein